MTTWQSKPLAAMSLWDYDDLQKALTESPIDTLPKLLKRLEEFLTRFRGKETDADLVGETVILLSRVGAWSSVPAADLVPILLTANEKTRSVFFEELPPHVAITVNDEMQKELRKKDSEQNLRLASSIMAGKKRQARIVKDSAEHLMARHILENAVSGSPLAEFTFNNSQPPKTKPFAGLVGPIVTLRSFEEKQRNASNSEIYGAKKKKAPITSYLKA